MVIHPNLRVKDQLNTWLVIPGYSLLYSLNTFFEFIGLFVQNQME